MTSELIITTLINLAMALTAYLKAHSENGAIVKAREATKQDRDTAIALLKQKVEEHDKMMENGNDRFDRIERELKETNGLLRELLGMFKMSTRAKDHQPE